MNDKQIIDYIKINHTFPKTLDDYFNYGMLIFPICLIVMGLVMIYNVIHFGNNDLTLFALGCLIIGFPFLRFTWIRLNDNLRFEEFITGMSKKENMENSSKICESRVKIHCC